MPDPKTIELVKRELDDLIAIGEKFVALAATARDDIKGSQLTDVMTWVTRSGHIIRKVGGEGSEHDGAFRAARSAPNFTTIHGNYYAHLCEIGGALKGLRHALEAGLLQDLRRLLQADIFADFLEMAEHLLSEGYKDASAVMIGGVLEDTLRKLSASNNLPLLTTAGKPLTIEPLNVNLAKAGIYSPLTKKQVTSWADLRNNAAHGDYTKYTADEVKQMLLFVQRFCADFLQ
jgi:hypothetical protein